MNGKNNQAVEEKDTNFIINSWLKTTNSHPAKRSL